MKTSSRWFRFSPMLRIGRGPVEIRILSGEAVSEKWIGRLGSLKYRVDLP